MVYSRRSRREAFEALRRFIDKSLISPEDTLPEIFEFEVTDDRRFADRAAALIVVSLLEDALKTAISTHFVPTDDNAINQLFGSGIDDGPLATFSARIRLGYALGIYGPDMRADLDTIRLIRNVFAHSRHLLDFSSPEIQNVCKQFIFPTKFPWNDLVQMPTSEKEMFIQITKWFLIYLISSPGDKALTYRETPGWEDLAS